MKITTKSGITLELPDNAHIEIDGEKISVGAAEASPAIQHSFQIQTPPLYLGLPSLYPHCPTQPYVGDPHFPGTTSGGVPNGSGGSSGLFLVNPNNTEGQNS